MTETLQARVLFIDDERRVLDGIRRHLRREFDVTLAQGASAALKVVAEQAPFEVIVSDLRMPGMDGITLLKKMRQVAPDSVRMLLTGNADLDSAVTAVNEGALFRFLTKPCPADRLRQAVRSGIEHHRLLTAERVLLEQTLRGSIEMLSEVLSLADPLAFGRAGRLKRAASEIAEVLGLEPRWPVEVAAMLSQVGCVILPDGIVRKLHTGEALELEEEAEVRKVPEVLRQIVGHIPRMDAVRDALAYQAAHFDGSEGSGQGKAGEDIPLEARVLHVVLDADALEASGLEGDELQEKLESRTGRYDPAVLDALRQAKGRGGETVTIRSMMISELEVGVTLAEDCESKAGRLLVARGQEVSSSVLARLKNFQENEGIAEPIRVKMRPEPGEVVKEDEEARGA